MRRLLAHTADLRAELVAPGFAGLVEEAVGLVRELLVGDSPVEPRLERRLPLAGADEAEQLFGLVRELVYLADAERFLPAGVRLEGGVAVVAGEPFDGARHTPYRQLKALTRHAFRVEQRAEGLVAELVFDL